MSQTLPKPKLFIYLSIDETQSFGGTLINLKNIIDFIIKYGGEKERNTIHHSMVVIVVTAIAYLLYDDCGYENCGKSLIIELYKAQDSYLPKPLAIVIVAIILFLIIFLVLYLLGVAIYFISNVMHQWLKGQIKKYLPDWIKKHLPEEVINQTPAQSSHKTEIGPVHIKSAGRLKELVIFAVGILVPVFIFTFVFIIALFKITGKIFVTEALDSALFLALVIITAGYALNTSEILNETRKDRKLNSINEQLKGVYSPLKHRPTILQITLKEYYRLMEHSYLAMDDMKKLLEEYFETMDKFGKPVDTKFGERLNLDHTKFDDLKKRFDNQVNTDYEILVEKRKEIIGETDN